MSCFRSDRSNPEGTMETSVMGRVLVTALVENLDDLFAAGKGLIPEGKIRRAEVTDALVDTGATGLLVPRRLIEQLGLEPLRFRTARTIAGQVPLHVYRAVRLTISDVAEVPGDFSIIIGQVPLELMDWIVDARGQRLVGNPAHGGEHMIEA
jgi:predicted aspartyl protease